MIVSTPCAWDDLVAGIAMVVASLSMPCASNDSSKRIALSRAPEGGDVTPARRFSAGKIGHRQGSPQRGRRKAKYASRSCTDHGPFRVVPVGDLRSWDRYIPRR